MEADFEALADEVTRSVNDAMPGRMIADSEEAVRDAAAEFRRRLYQQAIELRTQVKGAVFFLDGLRGIRDGATRVGKG